MRINQISDAQKKKEGKLLEAKMEEYGVTQEQLAHEMEVSQGTISKWRLGNKALHPKRLLWLANRFEFDPIEVRPSLLFEFSGVVQSGSDSLSKKLTIFLSNAGPEDRKRLEAILDLFPTAPNRHPDNSQ